MARIKYLPVNWVDGMKIGKDHFIASENALSDQIHASTAAFVNKLNYGLLPIEPGEDSSLKFSLDLDDQKVIRVRLSRCNAITIGGVVVDIHENNNDYDTNEVFPLETSIEFSAVEDGEYLIILSVDTFRRVPVGAADPKESPPRNPFVLPDYKLNIIAKKNISVKDLGKYFLPIGMFVVSGDKVSLESNYIPPCSSVSSHYKLISLYNKLSEFWSKLERDIVDIIEKIHLKRQKSMLSGSVHEVSLTLLNFLGSHIQEHRWFALYNPPVFMVEKILRFARILKNSIEVLTHEQKEELINYFTDWCNLRTGEFENLLQISINVDYDHEDISTTLSQISQFIEVMDVLFTTLSNLDYIGKRRETQIFVKEEQKSRRSFLAED